MLTDRRVGGVSGGGDDQKRKINGHGADPERRANGTVGTADRRTAGGTVVLQYLPHELVGHYFVEVP